VQSTLARTSLPACQRLPADPEPRSRAQVPTAHKGVVGVPGDDPQAPIGTPKEEAALCSITAPRPLPCSVDAGVTDEGALRVVLMVTFIRLVPSMLHRRCRKARARIWSHPPRGRRQSRTRCLGPFCAQRCLLARSPA